MTGDVPKKIVWVFVFLILAAVAVLGVLFIRGYQSGRQVSAVDTSPSSEPTSDSSQDIALTINEPSADVATTSAKLNVAGATADNAVITVLGGADDAIVVADGSGNFSSSVSLNEGLNHLVFTAYSDDGDQTSVNRNIVYTKGSI